MKCFQCGFYAPDTDGAVCPLCRTAASASLWTEGATIKPLNYSLLSVFGSLIALVLMFRSE